MLEYILAGLLILAFTFTVIQIIFVWEEKYKRVVRIYACYLRRKAELSFWRWVRTQSWKVWLYSVEKTLTKLK